MKNNSELYQDDIDHFNKVPSIELPLNWEIFSNKKNLDSNVKTESIQDGFVRCLNDKGCVDMEYISAITGASYQKIIETLKGCIYQNPEHWNACLYQGWETAEEYLSGNIRKKIQSAKKADKEYQGYFTENIQALQNVLPSKISVDEIYVTLGSPWIPVDVIEDFIYYITRESRVYVSSKYRVKHDEVTGTWEFDWDYKHPRSFAFQQKYGTGKMGAFEILLKTLNQQSVAVKKTIRNKKSKSEKQTVIDTGETFLTLDKQKLFLDRFRTWVWIDPERKARLESIYEERYTCIRTRHYDGSFLELPGLSKTISLYPYQKNAVARILFSPNTLLAHDVGSGKTYIMIAAGMELRRLNLSKKNMYVVPNNLTRQWKTIYDAMYPAAEIKCIEPKNFTPKKRQAVLEDIRNNDYDAVIIAYSCFSQIPISIDCQLEILAKKKSKLVNKQKEGDEKKTKKLFEEMHKLENQLQEKILEKNSNREEQGISFDELGITRLFVDEAHNFKNVPINTKIDHVMGISRTGSAKCRDMMDKVRIVQHHNAGKGVVLATGTPITNSITDIYIMQQYLQSGELEILDLESFDSWVGMFAEKTTNFEIDVDTTTYRMATRFAKFHNIPELTTMLASFADFHQTDEMSEIPQHDGYQDIVISKSHQFQDYLMDISERTELVRHGMVNRSKDNMLLITMDGRKAALDLRLVGVHAVFSHESKVVKCVDHVWQIYERTKADRMTQLIFCDISTPKNGFNIYDEVKMLLVKKNIPASEIAYIHDAVTEDGREKIFRDVRNGTIRVLLGSTCKLGLGVNVQDKLVAIHHLDVPWRPADMVQREGRILRKGNENRNVQIYRYITEGSFDAYSWQLLETKQRFISELLSGTAKERTRADIDDTVLNYAEVKAIAIGNPLIKERVETVNQLSRYLILQRKITEQHQQYEMEVMKLPDKIEQMKKQIRTSDADIMADQRLVEEIWNMEEHLTFMEQALIEDKNYLDEIESCREKLAEIDIRLGMNQE